MNKIARLYLVAWIFGFFTEVCVAADDDQRPPEHLCPITQAVMIDPVVAADGQSYEREAISRWLVTSRKSPLSNADLDHTNLIANLSLKKMISDWRPGRQRKPSNLDAKPAADIAQRIKAEFEKSGFEEVYRRFFKGVLIYKKGQPDEVRLPIAALANPLKGVFDLSQCGDSGQYLSIATGYRKGKKAKNANKVEIWLAPRFLIERNLATSASHLQPIMGDWNAATAPAGVFWTWGGWDNMGYFDYLTTNSFDDLGSEDLLEKYGRVQRARIGFIPRACPGTCTAQQLGRRAGGMFHVSFLN